MDEALRHGNLVLCRSRKLKYRGAFTRLSEQAFPFKVFCKSHQTPVRFADFSSVTRHEHVSRYCPDAGSFV